MISKPESCSFQLCGGLNPFWEPQNQERNIKVLKHPFLVQKKTPRFSLNREEQLLSPAEASVTHDQVICSPVTPWRSKWNSHSKTIGTWKIGIQTCWCSGFRGVFHCILHQGLRNVGKRKPRKECISRTESDHGVDRIYELAHFLAKRKWNPPKK